MQREMKEYEPMKDGGNEILIMSERRNIMKRNIDNVMIFYSDSEAIINEERNAMTLKPDQ